MKLSGDPASFLLLRLNQPAAHARERRFRQFALRDVDESDHGPNNLFSSQLRIGPIFGRETCSISPPLHLLFPVVSLPGSYYPVNSTFLHREQRSIRTSVMHQIMHILAEHFVNALISQSAETGEVAERASVFEVNPINGFSS
jgi:hypothetical protein